MEYTLAYKLHVPVPQNPPEILNTDIYMCKSVDGMSWIGNKIIFTKTGYSIDEKPVQLTSIGFIPEKNKIYNFNATAEIIEISENIDVQQTKVSGYLTEYYECAEIFPAYNKCLVMYVKPSTLVDASGIYIPSR